MNVSTTDLLSQVRILPKGDLREVRALCVPPAVSPATPGQGGCQRCPPSLVPAACTLILTDARVFPVTLGTRREQTQTGVLASQQQCRPSAGRVPVPFPAVTSCAYTLVLGEVPVQAGPLEEGVPEGRVSVHLASLDAARFLQRGRITSGPH